MSERIIVFGATTVGRKIACMLAACGVSTRLCVNESYGEEVIEPGGLLKITSKCIESGKMASLILESGCELVIDATHIYARGLTENVRAACEEAGVERIRLRGEKSELNGIIRVDAAQEAVALLNKASGKALLTIGSKELGLFTRVKGCETRLFARVLPSVETLQKCLSMGFPASHIICVQGPFTHEMNAATIKMLGVTTMVTKDSGYAGGLFEKLSAARETGCRLILIRREDKPEAGMDYDELCKVLAEKFSLTVGATRKNVEAKEQPQPFFPVFVNLEGKRVTVVGGGATALKRAKTLIKFGAEVRFIAPDISLETAGLVHEGKATWLQIEFEPQLLEGSDIVVAAADHRDVNRAVGEAAKKMQILVNVTDSREESTYLFPSVVQSDTLVAGFVTTDNDYAAVKRIAQKLREKLSGGKI